MNIIIGLLICSLFLYVNTRDPPTPKIEEVFTVTRNDVLRIDSNSSLMKNCSLPTTFIPLSNATWDALAPKIARCLINNYLDQLILGTILSLRSIDNYSIILETKTRVTNGLPFGIIDALHSSTFGSINDRVDEESHDFLNILNWEYIEYTLLRLLISC